MELAKSYVGTNEKQNKVRITQFLNCVNRKYGDSWCAAFVSFCLEQFGVSEPNVRSGLARNLITKKSIRAEDVIAKYKKIPAGSIAVWKKGNTIYGHTGFVIETFTGSNLKTVEGNTSATNKGDQANGDGVYLKERIIKPYSYFRITHFTLVK